jgi:hypothetical protein
MDWERYDELEEDGDVEGLIEEEPDDEIDRMEYITQEKQDEQNDIVNVRQMNTCVIPLYTWTHRTTGCDVISTVTTTTPMKNGNMKDIKMYNKEMRRSD